MKTSGYALGATLAVGLLLGAAPAGADGLMDQLKARMDQPGENVYPDPQEKALTRIKYEPDQLVWLFRQARASAHRKATGGGGVDYFLADALAEKHRAHCWGFTKRLRRAHQAGKEKSVRRFLEYLEKPAQPEDLAAFAPVFERLPDDLRESFAPAAEAAAQATAALEDESRRADYVTRCEAEPEFFKKKGALSRLWGKAKKGMDGLIDRLEVRFSKENLARFFSRISGSRLTEEVRGKASEAVRKLQDGLLEKVLEDLDDQLEGGLGGKIQEIELAGGFVRTKTAVTRGRLRVLLKLMQALKDEPQDLRLFMPTFRAARRGIKQRLGRSDLDEEGRKYLTRLDETLETSAFFLESWAKKPASESGPMNVFRAMWKALVAEDFEGIFEEVKADPDLF